MFREDGDSVGDEYWRFGVDADLTGVTGADDERCPASAVAVAAAAAAELRPYGKDEVADCGYGDDGRGPEFEIELKLMWMLAGLDAEGPETAPMFRRESS